jgi:hypothetical protein
VSAAEGTLGLPAGTIPVSAPFGHEETFANGRMVGDYWAMANQGAFLASGVGLVGAAKCGSFASKALTTLNAVQDGVAVGLAVKNVANGEFGWGDALSLAFVLAAGPRSVCFEGHTPVALRWDERQLPGVKLPVGELSGSGDSLSRSAALGIGVALVGMAVGVRREQSRVVRGRRIHGGSRMSVVPQSEGSVVESLKPVTERAIALDECFRTGEVPGDERVVPVRDEYDAGPSRLAMGIVRALAACAMLLAGIGSLAYALTGSVGDVERAAVASVVPQYGDVPVERRLLMRPIESIRLGMRTLGTNPDRSQVAPSLNEPQAANWRTVELVAEQENGGELRIELLRPLSWLLAQEAAAGEVLWLDIDELDIHGPALVVEIGPSPEIESGPGNVVTGRFIHQAVEGSALLDIAFEGAEGVDGVTPNHPFWSVDEREFVRADRLTVGERVDTAHGRAAVAHVAWRRAGPDTLLYNLETHGEHVYRVGREGVLVHNAGDTCPTSPRLHHPIPQFLGGNRTQPLTPLTRALHDEFHRMLHNNLQRRFPELHGLGGPNGSRTRWLDEFTENGTQNAAFRILQRTARQFDRMHGTSTLADVKANIKAGLFEVR